MSRKSYVVRYLGIVAVCCLICVIYLGRLFYIQITGRSENYIGDTTTRVVTVQAVRGEIYDRNGVPLVKNRYTYDLTLSWASFHAPGQAEANRTALFLLEECARENAHVEKYPASRSGRR